MEDYVKVSREQIREDGPFPFFPLIAPKYQTFHRKEQQKQSSLLCVLNLRRALVVTYLPTHF